ncbi:MAG TPA: DMT family transporter [Leucothrix mucor]|nr:DMT family transporter [Leucothrix mucor]
MKTYLKLLVVMLIWGGTFTSARLLGGELEPAVSAFLRFLIASVVLLLLLYFKEGGFPRVTRKQFVPLLGMGLTGIAMYNLFFFYALANAEAGRGALITATNPLIVAVFAAFVFKEKFTPVRVVGFVLCVIGVVLIISRGDVLSLMQNGIGWGELAFLGCAFGWAIYTLIGRFISDQFSSLAIIAYSSSFGTVILFFVALNSDLLGAVSQLNFNASANLLFLSLLGTVVGFVWFQDGVKALGAAKAAVFIYFMPVSAVFWAYIILGEEFTMLLALGAVLVISGIYLVNKKESAQ